VWGNLSLEGEKKSGEVVDAVQASCNLRVCCPDRLGYIHRPASRQFFSPFSIFNSFEHAITIYSSRKIYVC